MSGSVVDFGDDAYRQWACPIDLKTTFGSSGARGQLLDARELLLPSPRFVKRQETMVLPGKKRADKPK